MRKDICFCIVIISVIIVLDYFVHEYIKNSTEEIETNLSYIREEILNEEESKINEVETQNVKELWKKRYLILASIIEHDELEKVEKNLIGLYSSLECKDKVESIAEIDENIFILKHIKEKYDFKLENVF